jgi:hypothetical protein
MSAPSDFTSGSDEQIKLARITLAMATICRTLS